MSKLKVKFLKHVTTPTAAYTPGQIVELEETLAKQICTPVRYADRDELFVKGIIVDAAMEAMEGKVVVPLENLTVADMDQLGIKNVVKTPEDPEYKKFLQEAGALETKKNSETRKTRLEQRQQLAQSPE